MELLYVFIMLISILFGQDSRDKAIITKVGNITTIQIGDQIFKSAETILGEAWTSFKPTP